MKTGTAEQDVWKIVPAGGIFSGSFYILVALSRKRRIVFMGWLP